MHATLNCSLLYMPGYHNYAANAQIVGANPAALEAAVVKYNATSSPFVGQGRKLSGATSSARLSAPYCLGLHRG